MKNKIIDFAVIACLTGALVTGCDKTPEQQLEGVKQEVSDAKAEFPAEWKKFKTESEAQIKKNEIRIAAFKEKMEKAGSNAKANYNKSVMELERKNRGLKKKLEEYNGVGQRKWEEFKTNFKHDMDGIGKTMKDLFKESD
jgi:hypothetical protein